MTARPAVVVALALVGALLAPAAARAQGAEPDSALRGYLGGLADSTDHYFGRIAAPLDTAGLDSALIAELARPADRRRPSRLSLWPDLRFDRVDGTALGGGAALGASSRGIGRLEGRLLYAGGTDAWLGDGRWSVSRRAGDGTLTLSARAGRNTVEMDTDAGLGTLGTVRAFLFGRDPRHLLRRDGISVRLGRRASAWRIALGFRDDLERPLPVTTTWDLFNMPLLVPGNRQAVYGRTHEAELELGARLPRTPLELTLKHAVSSPDLGSAFDYRRTRADLTGDVGLGRRFAAVPQLAYGRLTGDPLPQAAFYLGGAGTLSAAEESALSGTRMAFARLDLMTTFDVLEAARLPHPAVMPLQAGVFASTGALWGGDPSTDASTDVGDWPGGDDWRPEVGVSLLYQPGFPIPDVMLRADLAMSVGPHRTGSRISLGYTRAIHASSDHGR
jgi:hypothetical protein